MTIQGPKMVIGSREYAVLGTISEVAPPADAVDALQDMLGWEEPPADFHYTIRREEPTLRELFPHDPVGIMKEIAMDVADKARAKMIRNPVTTLTLPLLASLGACITWQTPTEVNPAADAPTEEAEKQFNTNTNIERNDDGTFTAQKPATAGDTLYCSKQEPMFVVGEHGAMRITNNKICARLMTTTPWFGGKPVDYTGIRLTSRTDGSYGFQRTKAWKDAQGNDAPQPYGAVYTISPEVMKAMTYTWSMSNSPQSWPYKLKVTFIESKGHRTTTVDGQKTTSYFFNPNALNKITGASSLEQITFDTYVYHLWHSGKKLGLGDRQEDLKEVMDKIGGYLNFDKLRAHPEVRAMWHADRFNPEISGLIGEANREFLRVNAQTAMLSNGYSFNTGTHPYVPNEIQMYLSHNQAKLAKKVFSAYHDNPEAPISNYIKGQEFEANWHLFQDRSNGARRTFTVAEVIQNLQKEHGFTTRLMQDSYIYAAIPKSEFKMPAITDLTGTFIVTAGNPANEEESFWYNPIKGAPWIVQQVQGFKIQRVSDLNTVSQDVQVICAANDMYQPLLERFTSAGECKARVARHQRTARSVKVSYNNGPSLDLAA